MRPLVWLAALALAAAWLGLGPNAAAAHLFHKVYELPETQLTRDARLLQLLLDDERFELARSVYEGETRVRLRPGGFRAWLKRPTEPGMVFKAAYQLERWSGSLEAEAGRIDRERGATLDARIEAGLARRDREAVNGALREMFVVLLDELLESLAQRLDQPETAIRLYPYVSRYYGVSLEGYMNLRHPGAATTARAALDAMARALPGSDTGAPSAPEAFDKQRRRFLRVLKEAIARR